MNSKNIKKAGLFYTFGSFFSKGIAFFTVPIFTRILSTTDYGMVSTYNSWVGIVTVLLSMTLYMAIRQSFIDYPDRVDEIHSTITIFITAISFATVILCIIGGAAIGYSVLIPIFCIIQGYAAALIENYSMQLMMQYRYILRTCLMVLPNLVSIILAVMLILQGKVYPLYLGRIIPTAIVIFIFGIAVLGVVLKRCVKFDFELLKYSLAISVPLIAHGLALTILSQSDRTMITAIVGADKTGIYSVVYNFSMIAMALTTALGGIWQPWYLAKLKNGAKEDLNRVNEMTKAYTLFMTAIMCGVIMMAPEVLRLLASEQYWEGVSIIPPIVLANLITFIYTFYVDIEHFHKKTKSIAGNTIFAAVCNIILNLIFIRLCGYEAAAYTTIASYAVSLMVHYIYAKKLEPRITSLKSYWPMFMVVIVVSIIYYTAIDYWYIRWIVAFGVAIYVLVYLYRKYGIFFNNHKQ